MKRTAQPAIPEEISDSTILWRKFVEAETTATAARMRLYPRIPALTEQIRESLSIPHERAVTLQAIGLMKLDQRQELFDDLLELASFAHGLTLAARQLILSLPHDWLLANIEDHSERLLHNGTYEEYRRLLELYEQIDSNLTLRLAQRAKESSDSDIKEAGEDFMERITSNIKGV